MGLLTNSPILSTAPYGKTFLVRIGVSDLFLKKGSHVIEAVETVTSKGNCLSICV